MKKIILPDAPRISDFYGNGFNAYVQNQKKQNQDFSDWARNTKSILEGASKINDSPLSQPFVVNTSTGFVLTTAISGTSTGTDIANFVCSLVQAMIKKGIISQTTINT